MASSVKNFSIIFSVLLLFGLFLFTQDGFGQRCVGHTVYIVRNEQGQEMNLDEMKNIIVKSFDDAKVSLLKVVKDANKQLIYCYTNSPGPYPNFYLVANKLNFVDSPCGSVREVTLVYRQKQMKLIFNVSQHNTHYEIDSLPFQEGIFRLNKLDCIGGKAPPLIDNENYGVCRVSADNWKKVEQEKNED